MSVKAKLLTTTFALGLLSGAAVAQSENTQPEQPATEMAQAEYAPGWNDNLDSVYGDIADTRVEELIGMNVVTEGGDDVGEVDNFVLIGDRIQAVVGVGGFLGLGEHEVALPLDELAFDGERLIIAYTEDELRAMPEYFESEENTTFAADDTFRTRTMPAMTDTDSTAMDMADGTIEDPSEADAPSGEEVAAAEEAAGDADTMTEEVAEAEKGAIEQETEEMAAEADAAVTEGATEVAEAANTAGEAVEEGAEDLAQATDNAVDATGEAIAEGTEEVADAAEATGEAIEQGAENAAQAAENAAEETGDWFQKLENEFAEIADWQIDEFEGYNVATTDGNVVGEIDDVGRIDGQMVAIVGMGGFLGLGEHDVAVDFSRLTWDGEKFVAEGYTEAELEEMPEYAPESFTEIEGDTTFRAEVEASM